MAIMPGNRTSLSIEKFLEAPFAGNYPKLIKKGTKAMYMQRTTSGAAGNGMCTTIKYMRGASGIGMGTTIQHLRRKKGAAPRETAWAQR